MASSAPLSALRDGVVVAVERHGVVRARGSDARPFLHRMSTQHVEERTAGEAVLNVFPNKQGRCVDLVHQLTLADDDVVLLSALPEGETLIAWLDEFLFVEEVELTDLTDEGVTLLVAGAGASGALDAAELEPWAMRKDGDRVVVRTFDLGDGEDAWPAFLLWQPGGDADAIVGELGATAVESLELARVASGVPAAPGEVSDRYNPLELGLHDAIHWAKGCYIGQEVIARIDNYGKQSKQLIGLSLDDVAGLEPGADVARDGKVIGALTSVAPALVPGGVSALAVVKHKGDVVGESFDVAGRSATVVPRRAEQAPHD